MSIKISRAKVLRQKVISLMYLIFVVMVFLYVPSDFIDTIKDVNYSMEGATREMKIMNNFNVNLLKAIKATDSTNQISNYPDYIDEVMHLTDSVNRVIEYLKMRLQRDAGGLNTAGYLVNGKESYQSDEIFITSQRARLLKELLENYKRKIIKLTGFTSFGIPINSIIKTEEFVYTSTGKLIEWQKFYFYKVPSTVTITLLSKFQNDIRKVEYLTIAPYLFELINEFDITLKRKVREGEKKRRPIKEKPIIDPRAKIESDDFVILYTDIDNLIKVEHPFYSNTELIAKISNGEIYLKDTVFYARVKTLGINEVIIYHQRDTLTPLIRQKFVVKPMPDPIAVLADRKGGIISHKIFKLQKNIAVHSKVRNFTYEYLIKRFSLIQIPADGTLIRKSKKNAGGYFNASTQQMIDEATRGDIYIFYNIEAETLIGNTVYINAIVFTLI